jgi:tetratricopeptide (TPR) repeat protein
MKPLALPLIAVCLLAAAPLQFDITDARGKQTSAVTIEAGSPDADGWQALKIGKAKGEPVLLWPFDGKAKLPDGPEAIPAIVIQKGEERALMNRRVVAAMATPIILGLATLEDVSRNTGIAQASFPKAFAGLTESSDPFEKGVGLLYSDKAGDAGHQFGLALRQRQRQLTRFPSEIYPLAMLYGQALYRAGKFDDAAVAFLTALKLRPSDEAAENLRASSLIKAGKPEAAGR